MQLLAGIHQSDLWQQLITNCQLPIISNFNDELSAEYPAALLQSCISLEELQLLLQRQAKQAAEQNPAQVALCFDAPEMVIGRSLQQGNSIKEAVASWQQQTTVLLQVQQQYRRQLQLLQTDALLQNPAAAPDWLATAQQSAAEPQAAAQQIAEPFVASSPDIYVLLAAQALRQDNQAYQLWQRLIACSLPLTEQTSLVLDLQNLQQQLTNNSKEDALQSQLNASNEERDLLLQQLLHVQEELEQLFQKKQNVKQQYSQLEQDYRNEMATLTAQLQNGEQTVEKTAEQLHKFQDELTRITEAHNQTQQQLSASNDERGLLLQQLLDVQEELEKLFLQEQALKRKHDTLEQGYRTEVTSLNEKLQQAEQAIAKRDKQLNALQQESTQLATEKQALEKQNIKIEQDFRKEIASQNEKLQRLDSEHASLQQQHTTIKKEHATLQRQHADTESSLAVSNSERDLFQRLLLNVQDEMEQFHQKNLQLQANLDKATNAYQAEHKQTITLQKQNERSQSKLEQQLKVAVAEAARARQQAAAFSNELAAIKGSTLWKSGAPVRKLASVLSKSERERQRMQQDAALIYTSEYFDVEWYLQSYPDVAESGINPAEHYLRFGAKEGRYPGPLFDGNWYQQRYADVAEAGLNPLLHFIKFGCAEGRTASPILLANKQQSTAKATANKSAKKNNKGSKV
ncbi:hypothetical protein [Arsukibacterium sp.]|uniref:hypothetical protein n=1 Tax=Arsukibacterium sp. TaxID=1977258 RepID=UPI001BD21995|nr:hypothetical protein [Arsukibacterium sp.]